MISWSPAQDGVAWITLDRQEQRNAFDWAMLEAFGGVLDELERDRSIRVVIIRSALERVFVAGGDIAVMRDLDLEGGTEFVYAGQRLLRRLEESRKVFIAAVGGFALGGGTELTLACDLVVASDAATFGFPETKLGLLPGWGGTQRMVRVAGLYRAKELVFTGRRLTSAEAKELGFVNRVVPAEELEAAALGLAEEILAVSPSAVRESKVALTQGAKVSLDQGLVIEAEAWLANLSSPNRVEGLTAFLEKREPRFSAD
jgi:enoyl-CoA hydratase